MILCEKPLIEGSGNDTRVITGLLLSGLAVSVDREVYGEYPVIVNWAKVVKYKDYTMIRNVGKTGEVILREWVEMVKKDYPELLEVGITTEDLDMKELRKENVRLRQALRRIQNITSGVLK